MNNNITTVMNVNDNEIRVMRIGNEDYISLTDLARYKNPFEPKDVTLSAKSQSIKLPQYWNA